MNKTQKNTNILIRYGLPRYVLPNLYYGSKSIKSIDNNLSTHTETISFIPIHPVFVIG